MTNKQQPYQYTDNCEEATSTVMDTFLSGLRSKTLLGIRSSNDAVIIPPMEIDPLTGETLCELVNVGDQGEVVLWCWVRHPNDRKTARSAYAWALIKLDGADSPIIHRVVTNDEKLMVNGMRVKVRWAEFTSGRMSDIICFDPIEK